MGNSLLWVIITNSAMVYTCMGIICEEDVFPDSSELIGEENMNNCSCSNTTINCRPFLELEIFGSHEDNTPLSLEEASRAKLR